MKNILITGAGGSLSDFNKPKNELKSYAKKHKFDFEYRDFKDNYKLAKLELIKEKLSKGYYWVLWIDYDVRVLDEKRNILDDILEGDDMYLAQHKIESGNKWKNMLNGFNSYYVYNTGVMLIKNTKYSRDLIDAMIFLVKDYYKEFNIVDNGAFLHLIGRKDLLKKLYFGHNYNSNIKFDEENIGWLINDYNYIRDKNSYIEDGIVFEHYAGVKNREDYLI